MSGYFAPANVTAATYSIGDPNGTPGSLGSLKVDTTTGTIYRNTDGGTTWAVFSAPGGSSNVVGVSYTSNGTGETDFMVTIGIAMPTDGYKVVQSVENGAFSPSVQLPNQLAGDRTLTQFRVVTTALEVGQVLNFIVVG